MRNSFDVNAFLILIEIMYSAQLKQHKNKNN